MKRTLPLLSAALFAFCLGAHAQAPLTEWSSDSLNLRFSYPSDLAKGDPASVVHDGNLTLPGVSDLSLTRCLRPDLLAQSATATIVLAELDVTCLTLEQQATPKDLLANLAEIVNKTGGMTSIAPPAWYNVGWQKVHMAAAQGTPDSTPQRLYTMGFSTGWNSHLLVWFFTSTDIQTLNRITKSTVRFGRSAAAPLYPSPINDAGPKN
ncbi:hypothetical protein BH10ACI4_BH10ACI4_33150 [soil metagenome]